MTIPSLFYRQGLSAAETTLYDAVMDGLNRRARVINVRVVMDVNRANDVCLRVLTDNPLVYDVNSFAYRTWPESIEVQPQYRSTDQEYEQVTSACVKKLLSALPSLKTPSVYDTVLNIHDHICRSVTYSRDIEDWDHTCANPVLLGKGVCDGISKMFKIMCNLADVECAVVTGDSLSSEEDTRPGPHAWNIVRIDGRWYDVDVTYDLNPRYGEISHDYFCMSDSDISGDHFVDNPMNLCGDGSMYYHRKVGITIHNLDEFDTVIKVMERVRGDTLSFKIDGPWNPDPNDLLRYAVDRSGALFAQYGISSNTRIKVYTVHRAGLAPSLPSFSFGDILGLFRRHR